MGLTGSNAALTYCELVVHCGGPVDMSVATRRFRHGRVSTALALLSDQRLNTLLNSAVQLGTGIGGTTWLLEIDSHPVFVKRVAVADLELKPENLRSTADLFGLPTWTHYGLGSAAGSAWRELACHIMTSDWVLAGQSENFLLMHHWRVLASDTTQPMTPDRAAELEQDVAFWHGDAAVRHRLEAVADSSTDLVLFLEYVPQTLHEWLEAQADVGIDQADRACEFVEPALRTVAEFIAAQGLRHFDTHFRNILTDGRSLYLTDVGLAASSRFELSDAEAQFLHDHASHDGCSMISSRGADRDCRALRPHAPLRGAGVRRADRAGIPAGVREPIIRTRRQQQMFACEPLM
ncbi:MAG: hypothetical protein JWN03_9047 [Nocardia sp.]|nr:hypothetical protein [Nocardia sp.]